MEQRFAPRTEIGATADFYLNASIKFGILTPNMLRATLSIARSKNNAAIIVLKAAAQDTMGRRYLPTRSSRPLTPPVPE